MVAWFAARASLGLPPHLNGGGRQVRDLTHVDDIAEGTRPGAERLTSESLLVTRVRDSLPVLARMKPMDHLLHLDRTLDELDTPRWAPPAPDATRLVRKVHELRRVPLGELGPADLRTLISQQVALPYVLPLAVRLLLEEPLIDAYFYEGDLLLATVNVPASAWSPLSDLGARLCTVIAALPEEVLTGLPRVGAEELARFVARTGLLR
ncbi:MULTISPECIES: contact-dependent growth inhibition system immunity protein [unclassified Streptomyces]|uniref:contact-dependent growth inhibition system immunity protein n=1 Tax=unclassified Streptomyces TaxID=2593676 RepID=UPI0034214513